MASSARGYKIMEHVHESKFLGWNRLKNCGFFFIIFSQLTKEKKSLDDKLQEMTQQLGDEEEKAKSLAKQKAKQEAVIADLEERLRNAERVMMEIPTRFWRCAPTVQH